jgi:hypothetical protein
MSDAKQIETLRDRIDGLEASRRWLCAGLVGMGLLGAFLAAESLNADSPEAKSIRAREFLVTDSEGRVRARLGVGTDDSPSVALFDEEGREKITLQTGARDYASIQFYGEQGVRLSLAAGEDGTSGLHIHDAQGRYVTTVPSPGSAPARAADVLSNAAQRDRMPELPIVHQSVLGATASPSNEVSAAVDRGAVANGATPDNFRSAGAEAGSDRFMPESPKSLAN